MSLLREYPNSPWLALGSSASVEFALDKRLLSFGLGHDEVLFSAESEITHVDAGEAGWWLTRRTGDNERLTEFLETESKLARVWPLGRAWNCIAVGNTVAYADAGSSRMCIADMKGGLLWASPIEARGIAFNGAVVVAESTEGELVAWTTDGSERWRRRLDFVPGHDSIGATHGIVVLDDRVIANLGWRFGTGESGHLAACKLDSGELLWKHEYPNRCTVQYVEGRLLLAHAGFMRVVDARSGETVLEQQLDLPRPVTFWDQLYQHNGRLLYFSRPAGLVRVMDLEGRKLMDIKLSERFSVGDTILPFGKGVVCVVTPVEQGMAFAYKGLLYIDDVTREGDEVVDVEPRPAYRVSDFDEDSKVGYRIVLRTPDMEKLLRVGRVIIQETAVRFGRSLYTTDFVDKKWAGALVVAVDLASMSAEERSQFEQMLEDTREHLKLMGIASGVKGQPVRLTLTQATAEELASLPEHGIAQESIDVWDYDALEARKKPVKKGKKKS